MAKKNRSEEITSEETVSQSDVTEYDLPEEEVQPHYGRNRFGRLHRCNIRMLLLSVIMLMGLCAVLLVRIRTLNGKVSELTVQVKRLSQTAASQQALLEELAKEARTAMGNDAVVGERESGTKESGQAPEDTDKAQENTEEITAAHKVYLTFDDGPGANTQDILDILEEYDVKATFFVVGEACEKAEEELKKIVEAGHTLGMHSYSHKYSEIYASVDSFAEDLKKQQDYLYEVTGVKSTIYRFPGGSSNTVSDISMKEFAKYLDSQGIRFFDWNISSGDGGSYLFPTETIIDNCMKNIGKYSVSVILMHDSPTKTTTREALPKIIEKILDMEDTAILPITEGTEPVQHISWQDGE